MKKILSLVTLITVLLSAKAQIRGFGNIDTADLKLNSCDFEKDANAEVLFDRGKVAFISNGVLSLVRHRRIKIFNEKGKENANVRIEYDNMYGVDHIVNVEAQTLNLENGKVVVSKVDPKQIYPEHTDKNRDAIVISFPNVKAGSVIEYRYELARNMTSNFPAWYFQSDIPTRYSEFNVTFSPTFQFKALARQSKPFVKDTALFQGHVWAASELPSMKAEAFMRAKGDALESVSLLLTSVKDLYGRSIELSNTWEKIGKNLSNEKDYYKELDQHLSGEDTLIRKAAGLKTDDERIAYLFNAVKSTISWNGFQNWGSKEGIKNAWKRRVGNSAEVNAVLYHLLKKSGIKAYPMLVSTRENGLLQRDFVDIFQLNNLVAFVPVDTSKYYVLDATDKYSSYNQIPFDLLNSYGLCLDKEHDKYDMIYIEDKKPARQVIMMDAEIAPDAKMKGTCELADYSYTRTRDLKIYKTETEEKFKEFLTDGDNNIRISNLKVENVTVDTLPLHQKFDFVYDLNNSDSYIYFTPNLFTPLHENPFLSEERESAIDFGYKNDHVIIGRYKVPAGYSVESLPKNSNMVTADKNIHFKRVLQNQDGYISLRYEVSIKRMIYLKSDYPDIHEFFKKMYEMLNEQIVLKKT